MGIAAAYTSSVYIGPATGGVGKDTGCGPSMSTVIVCTVETALDIETVVPGAREDEMSRFRRVRTRSSSSSCIRERRVWWEAKDKTLSVSLAKLVSSPPPAVGVICSSSAFGSLSAKEHLLP